MGQMTFKLSMQYDIEEFFSRATTCGLETLQSN